MRLCDFCAKPGATQAFQGDGMVMVFVDAPQEEFPPMDLSGVWHACDTCAAFVRARDMEGLIAHILPAVIEQRTQQKGEADDAFEQFVVSQLRAMYAGLFGQLDGHRAQNN